MRAMVSFAGVGSNSSAQIERGKDSRLASLEGSVLEPLRMNDRLQVEERRFKQGVDYNEVEVPGLRDLDAGVRHPGGDHLGPVLAAAVQALLEFVPARRQDEDQDRVREQLLDLQRALP